MGHRQRGTVAVALAAWLGWGPCGARAGEEWRTGDPPGVVVGAGSAPGGGVSARVAVRF